MDSNQNVWFSALRWGMLVVVGGVGAGGGCAGHDGRPVGESNQNEGALGRPEASGLAGEAPTDDAPSCEEADKPGDGVYPCDYQHRKLGDAGMVPGWDEAAACKSNPGPGWNVRGARRVSLDANSTETATNGDTPALSGDGKWAVFISNQALSKHDRDANGTLDVYARELASDRVELVSGRAENTGGAEPRKIRAAGNKSSAEPAISGDGCKVVFSSYATDLIAGLNPGEREQVYLVDRCQHTTRLVSGLLRQGATTPGDGPSYAPAISADGQFVAFASEAGNLAGPVRPGVANIFLLALASNTLSLISVGKGGAAADGPSHRPFLSGDGQRVVFSSKATNLVGGDTNQKADIFSRWLGDPGGIVRVSVAPDGTEADDDSWDAVLSKDGLTLAFVSRASTLLKGTSEIADTNQVSDIYMRWSRASTDVGRIQRVSLGNHIKWKLVHPHSDQRFVEEAGLEQLAEASWSPALSGDGKTVAFTTSSAAVINPWGETIAEEEDLNGAADVWAVALEGSVDVGFLPKRYSLVSMHPYQPTAFHLNQTSCFRPGVVPSCSKVDIHDWARWDNVAQAAGVGSTFVLWEDDRLQSDSPSGSDGRQGLSDDGARMVFSSYGRNMAGWKHWEAGYWCDQNTDAFVGRRPVPVPKTNDSNVYVSDVWAEPRCRDFPARHLHPFVKKPLDRPPSRGRRVARPAGRDAPWVVFFSA